MMTVIEIDKNHSTFGKLKPDLRPFEQAWREDFPNSQPAPKSKTALAREWATAERYEA